MKYSKPKLYALLVLMSFFSTNLIAQQKYIAQFRGKYISNPDSLARDPVFMENLAYDLLEGNLDTKVEGMRRPLIVTYLAILGNLDVNNNKELVDNIPKIWEKYFSTSKFNDGSDEPNGYFFPKDASLLQIAVISGNPVFRERFVETTRPYKINLNSKDSRGNTILTWCYLKQDECNDEWCDGLNIHLDKWINYLIEAGAKTNEELEAIKTQD